MKNESKLNKTNLLDIEFLFSYFSFEILTIKWFKSIFNEILTLYEIYFFLVEPHFQNQ